jgi:pSer/pThr/pTyr-binding forkhead associated (FHA) protein
MSNVQVPPAQAKERVQWPELAWDDPVRVIGPANGSSLSGPPLRLRAIPGPEVVEIHKEPMTIGRHSEADLQLPQPEVSRFHCRLAWRDGGWTVQDLGSLNGTLVNGDHIEQARLQQYDVIRIADYLFQVDLGSGPDDFLDLGETDRQRSRQILFSIAALLPGDLSEELAKQ